MGIDEFDYKEPACATCGGKEFYYPETETHKAIPVERIIEKEDEFLSRNDLASAEKLLRYWLDGAKALNDKRGELVVTSELTGVFRKTGNKEESEKYCAEILRLIDETDMAETTSGATFLLNVATNKKAFGDAKGALKFTTKYTRFFQKILTRIMRYSAVYTTIPHCHMPIWAISTLQYRILKRHLKLRKTTGTSWTKQ